MNVCLLCPLCRSTGLRSIAFEGSHWKFPLSSNRKGDAPAVNQSPACFLCIRRLLATRSAPLPSLEERLIHRVRKITKGVPRRQPFLPKFFEFLSLKVKRFTQSLQARRYKSDVSVILRKGGRMTRVLKGSWG